MINIDDNDVLLLVCLSCDTYKLIDEMELQEAVNYSYKDIQLATCNFSDEYRVGKGGFGEVYKVIMV